MSNIDSVFLFFKYPQLTDMTSKEVLGEDRLCALTMMLLWKELTPSRPVERRKSASKETWVGKA